MTSIQKVVLGTAQFGLHYGINNKSGQPGERVVFDILDQAHRRGIRILDTAEDYGSAHSVIGKYIQAHPSRFQVISKMSGRTTTAAEAVQRFEKELEVLHVDRLHAYLFHKFENFKRHPQLTDAMVRLQEQGRIGKIGVSIYSNDEFSEAIRDERLEIIQLPFNLLDNRMRKDGLMETAREAGKEIHARSIFMQGLFFMEEGEIPAKLEALAQSLSRLKALAREAKVSLEALAFNYVINNQYVDKVLFGVDSLDQLSKSLDSLEHSIPREIFEQVDRGESAPADLLNPTNWK